jgi:hypothetical protein
MFGHLPIPSATRPQDKARCAPCHAHLSTLTLKHASLNTRFMAGNPWQVMVIDHHPLGVVGIDFHLRYLPISNNCKQINQLG